MLKKTEYGPVDVYRMGRSILGWVPYYVHAFTLGDTLIDSGTRFAADLFLRAIGNKKISRIINTHFHEDHIGNNLAVQEACGAEAYAHHQAIPYIENPRRNRLRPYQLFIWGYPKGSKALPIGDHIQAGDFTLRVIPVRGHSDDHICLHEPEKGWLFTGDMFCGIKNIYLRRDEDFHPLLHSLEGLSKLHITTIFCCLKGVIENGGAALISKIEFMKKLSGETKALREAGVPPRAIKTKLLGREDRMFYITGGHFSKQNLIDSIIKDI